ncbi:MAG: hypothetical protein M9947_12930 [Thermomicrobiales bacterium]|nr:hypothetical protein [Thermomicrobiales bacterium]
MPTPTAEQSSIFTSGSEADEGPGFRPAASATPTNTRIPTSAPEPTETAIATATTVELEVESTPVDDVEATETGEPDAEPTSEPTEAPEEIDEPDGDADRYVSSGDVERFEELRDQARAGDSIYGPVSGDVIEGVGVIQGIYPEIVTVNSYFRATFTNPDDMSVPYDVGFGIRHIEGNDQLRLIITSEDVWLLGIGDQPAYQTGNAYGFQSEPGEQNLVEVVADGNTGYLAINGTVVAVLDLSPSAAAGDIWVAAGLNVPDILSGRVSTVQDFEIWPLP